MTASDERRWSFYLLGVRLSAYRQTTPDHRWSVSVTLASGKGEDGQFGWRLTKGWAWRGQEHKRYYLGASLSGGITLSVRPNYRLVYAESFVRDVARLTGSRISETREHMRRNWKGEVPPSPVAGVPTEPDGLRIPLLDREAGA